jgi:hypothetical protein
MVKPWARKDYPELKEVFDKLEIVKKYNTTIRIFNVSSHYFATFKSKDIKTEQLLNIIKNNLKYKLISAETLSDDMIFIYYDKYPESKRNYVCELEFMIDSWTDLLFVKVKIDSMSDNRLIIDNIESLINPDITIVNSKCTKVSTI